MRILHDDTTFQIPERAQELKMRRLGFARKKELVNFADTLLTLLDKIVKNDAQHYVFLMDITPITDGSIRVVITNHDPLNDDAAMRKLILGDYQMRNSHFLVRFNASNTELLRNLFGYQGAQLKFVRVYERVYDLINIPATEVKVSWDGNRLNINSFILDGDDFDNLFAPPIDDEIITPIDGEIKF